MPSKDELSSQINEILGFAENPIDFTRLTKEELERLAGVFSTVAQVAQIGVRTAKEKFRGGLLGKPVGEVLNMPLIDLLTQLRGEGPLFGVLDRLSEAKKATRKTG